MISIYGSAKSSAGRCIWCLEEAGVEYKVEPINFREQQHKGPDFLELNPNGKIPVMTDGDFVLWESIAINSYIAESYKPELLGNNPKDRAHVNQWSVWSMVELQPPIIDIFIQMVFVPEDKRNWDLIKNSEKRLPDLLKTLDSTLKGRDYLVGNDFSLADINVQSVVSICEHIKFDISSYSNIANWVQNLSKKDSFRKYMELRS